MKVRIKTNAVDLSQKLAAVIGDQLPFVTAQTLTGVAFDVRDEESRGLDRYFTLRTNWSRRGIRVVRAEKRDFPNAFAIVGVRDPVLALNITGGKRKSDSGKLAVPLPGAREILNPGKRTLGPPRFPSRILKKKFFGNKPFVIKRTSGDLIAVRESNARKPISVLYKIKNDIDVNTNWPFTENAQRIVAKNYAKKFEQNLSKAFR